ncbi:MAG: methionyl aminopeptidase [Cyanobacteria bacterium]|nr:methionyl aminopeptidase [Cyanobacteriota bacterium]
MSNEYFESQRAQFHITTDSDLRFLRQANRIAADVLRYLCDQAVEGRSTLDLERLAQAKLARARATAPFEIFQEDPTKPPFGFAICVSIDDAVVNGPPSKDTILQSGHCVSIAIGTEYRGFYGKSARTLIVGDAISAVLSPVIQYWQDLSLSIQLLKTGKNTMLDVITVMNRFQQESATFCLLSGLGGCFTGNVLHTNVFIPNRIEDADASNNPWMLLPLEYGWTFTLMPMAVVGENPGYTSDPDGWTLRSASGLPAVHWADTYWVGPECIECLTHSAS